MEKWQLGQQRPVVVVTMWPYTHVLSSHFPFSYWRVCTCKLMVAFDYVMFVLAHPWPLRSTQGYNPQCLYFWHHGNLILCNVCTCKSYNSSQHTRLHSNPKPPQRSHSTHHAREKKSCLIGCGYSFIDLVSAIRKLMALTHALLSCLHSKLDAYVCIQFLGRLAKYLHVFNNPELQ